MRAAGTRRACALTVGARARLLAWQWRAGMPAVVQPSPTENLSPAACKETQRGTALNGNGNAVARRNEPIADAKAALRIYNPSMREKISAFNRYVTAAIVVAAIGLAICGECFGGASQSHAQENSNPLPSSAAQAARHQANCGEWQKAIESYNKALTTSPKDAVCLARRGYAYARLGDYKKALAGFATAIKCDADCSDAYSRRSRVYAWLGFDQLSKQDALKALELIPSAPKDPDLLLEHAGLLYSVEKTQEADKECKQVLASNSQGKDLSSLLIASDAHYLLRQYQDSVHCISQALKLTPGCFDLHAKRGASYWSMSQWTLATAEFNQYLTHNHTNPGIFCERGSSYYYQGEYAKAVADYDEAIKLAPNFVRAYYWRGLAYHYLNEYQKAIVEFSAALNLEPTNPYYYVERAHSECHEGEWASALKDTRQALLLNP